MGKFHLYSEYIEILEKDAKPNNGDNTLDTDHRLTLRIPKYLMEKIDIKRKQRVGKISRNLWILELIERATRS